MKEYMKVFYESKLAKWLLWQGYSTITLGCFVFTKKSEEGMKQFQIVSDAPYIYVELADGSNGKIKKSDCLHNIDLYRYEKDKNKQ